MKIQRRKALLFLSLLQLIFSGPAAQNISSYFEKIRNNEAALTAFISQMPKGGDLHNHYSGSIYAESYVNWLIEADYCINPQTLETVQPSANGECPSAPFTKFSTLKFSMKPAAFEIFKSTLIRRWSTKEYDQVHNDAREEHFFSTFGNFSPAGNINYNRGLRELVTRAKAENLSYIETMFTTIKLSKAEHQVDLIDNSDSIKNYNSILEELEKSKNAAMLKPVLKSLYWSIIQTLPVYKTAADFNRFIDSLHENFVGDDPAFTLRYQAFITRINDPLTTFINMVVAFEAVKQSSTGNLVGLNIVAPEDHPVSMQDYWLHMQMFAFCHTVYPSINYALHAGELTGGVVQPEELTWHISSAVYDAGAKRIGHGVDIAYEKNNYNLLRYMSVHHIPVEINLSSNEFILGVKDDRHPVLLYKHFNVPIVISTDDAGVSRTSLTEQYVLLARRYKEISYTDIKKFVYNGIVYSFIKDPVLKNKLIKDLDARFIAFEKYVLLNRR
jgi:Adenosine deaminase